MKNLTIVFRFSFLLFNYLFISVNSHSQTNAESIAKGETLPSSSYTLYSPSLFDKDFSEIRFHHKNLYCQKELNEFFTETAFFFPHSRIGTNITFWGYPHYQRWDFSTSLAKKLSEFFIGGCSFKLTTFHYTRKQSPSTFCSLTINIDCQWTIKEHNKLYTKINHQFLFNHQIESLKDWISIGYTLSYNNINCISEIDLWNYATPTIHLGFEYKIYDFKLQAGIKGLAIVPSYGIGYEYKKWNFNLSANWRQTLGHSFSIDICHQLTNKKQTKIS